MMGSPEINVLDVIEKRIEDVEKVLFGHINVANVDKPENTLLDSLGNANTFISSALSGRENINALIARLPELEKLTDSDFSTLDVLPQTQQEYLIAKDEEITELVNLLTKFKELWPLLDSNSFRNILDKSEKLNELILHYIDLYKQTEVLQKETREMLDRYNGTIENLSKIVIAADSKLNEVEKKLAPKRVLD